MSTRTSKYLATSQIREHVKAVRWSPMYTCKRHSVVRRAQKSLPTCTRCQTPKPRAHKRRKMFCSHTHPTKAQRCHLPRPQPEPELRRERNARLSLLSHPTTNPRPSPQPRGSIQHLTEGIASLPCGRVRPRIRQRTRPRASALRSPRATRC